MLPFKDHAEMMAVVAFVAIELINGEVVAHVTRHDAGDFSKCHPHVCLPGKQMKKK